MHVIGTVVEDRICLPLVIDESGFHFWHRINGKRRTGYIELGFMRLNYIECTRCVASQLAHFVILEFLVI